MLVCCSRSEERRQGMYRNDSDPQGQDAAGLDMFVGSGIDFLSEVTMEDMDRELFNSNLTVPWVPDHHLSPQNFVDFAPLAASLGPPGSTAEFDHRSGAFGKSLSSQGPCPEEQANAAVFPLSLQHLLMQRCLHSHLHLHVYSLSLGCCRHKPLYAPSALRQLSANAARILLRNLQQRTCNTGKWSEIR